MADFNFNFSTLSAADLQQDKISHREIITVYQGDSDATIWEAIPMRDKKNKTTSTIFNPFDHRDAEEVWAEIRKSTTPTTREEAMQAIQALRKKNK